jgi:serine/threonine protein phosphatase PrpC
MEYGAFSCKGVHRKSNEDHFYIPSDGHAGLAMIIVADGMGGHNAGDLASRIAVEHVSSCLTELSTRLRTPDDLMNAISRSIQEANDKIFELSKSNADCSGMGTTLTMAVFEDERFYVAHIGDSRCYLLRNGTARQITRDHSLVQELLDNGSITRDEMEMHPKKNVITRALGTEDRLRIDCFEETLEDGDIVLLCSDGLSNYVNLQDYAQNIPQNIDLTKLAEILGNEALAAGGSDDITIAAARYDRNEEKR